MIAHHPTDDLLLGLATGQLAPGKGFVIAAHVDNCVRCRQSVQQLLAVGGAMLEDIQPAALTDGALAQTLQRIDAPGPVSLSPRRGRDDAWPSEIEPYISARLRQDCSGEDWRWAGPGIRFSRIQVPNAGNDRVFLLKISAGQQLPRHTHSGTEFTQVLRGSFHDGRAEFGPGDFDETNEEVSHQPVVATRGECICLAYLQAPLRFEGWLARAAARVVGL